jgi:hypothetical protein
MAPLKDRLNIDWLKGVAVDTSTPRNAATDSSAQQMLAATVKGALASQAGQEAKVADLANSLGVKFSTLLPVVEGLADQGTLSIVKSDADGGGNHLVKLLGAPFSA